MANPFDKFDEAPAEPNPFDQFETEGAQRGVVPSVPPGASPTRAQPGGFDPGRAAYDAIDWYLSRAGKAVMEIPEYVGQGQQASLDSLAERASHFGGRETAPWEDFGKYASEQGQKFIDVPMAAMDALGFITRPIFGPVAKGIEGLTGGLVSPEKAEEALMALGPRARAPVPRPTPGPFPMKDVTPPKPPGIAPPVTPQARPQGPSPVPAPTTPQVAGPARGAANPFDAIDPPAPAPGSNVVPLSRGIYEVRPSEHGFEIWNTKTKKLVGTEQDQAAANAYVQRLNAPNLFNPTTSGPSKSGPVQHQTSTPRAPTAGEMRANAMIAEYEKDPRAFLRSPPSAMRDSPQLRQLMLQLQAVEDGARAGVGKPGDVAQVQTIIDGYVRAQIKKHYSTIPAATASAALTPPQTPPTIPAAPIVSPGAGVAPTPAVRPGGGGGVQPPPPPAGAPPPAPAAGGPGPMGPLPPPPPGMGPPGAPPPGGGAPPPPAGAPPVGPAGPPPPGYGPRPPFAGPATNPPPLPPSIVDFARMGATKIEQILSPTTVDDFAQLGEAVVREKRGLGLRETEQAREVLNQYNNVVRTMDEPAQLDFIDYMETRSDPAGARTAIPPAVQPLADAQRTLFQNIRRELELLPATDQMRFIEDYFPHLWDDPTAVANFMRTRPGPGKEGSAGFIKGREIPTVAEGLAAGLRLRGTNPIDAAMQYIENANRFIAQGKVFAFMQQNKFVKAYIPGRQPAGWTEIEGRFGGQVSMGHPQRYYAPDGLARIYNNAISKDMQGPAGDLVHALQRTSNWVTGLELSLSGFHFATMGQEAIANGFANAFLAAMKGRPVKAAVQAAKAFTNPIVYALTGGKVQRAYTGTPHTTGPIKSVGNALGPSGGRLDKIVELLTRAGGRAVHMENAYLSSRLGDYVSAWKKGTLKTEALADWRDIKGRPVTGTASVVSRHIGRIMDTVMKPLFQVYIPKLKAGAFADNMGQWLDMHPNATGGDQLKAARQIWDSIDNRFGEMVRDNIFWRNAHKQAAQIALRSYTWTYGFLREFGGGLADVGKVPWKATQRAGQMIEGVPKRQAPGQSLPRRQARAFRDYVGRKSPDDPEFTQRMAYVLGLPTAYVLGNIILQKLYTGEDPKDVQDLLAARTGGRDYSTGRPERIVTPGFMKDVFGWYNKGVLGETYAKMATLPRTGIELLTNKDWRGMPVYPTGGEGPNAPSWAKAVFDHVADNLGPFGIKQIVRGKEKGSQINEFMTMMGFQPTGMALTDPARYKRSKERHNKSEWRRKVRADRKEERKYQGPFD